jgi:hypothetical protein
LDQYTLFNSFRAGKNEVPGSTDIFRTGVGVPQSLKKYISRVKELASGLKVVYLKEFPV